MSVNSKMTAIADELRALMGATGALTLDGMAQQAGAANDAADAQAGLIAQIAEALEVKAGGGSGNSDGIQTGSYTPATYSKSITIGADIPEGDIFFAIFSETFGVSNNDSYILAGYFTVKEGVISGRNYGMSSPSSTTILTGTIVGGSAALGVKVTIDRANKTITFNHAGGSSNIIYFYGGCTYTWFIGKM